MPEQASSFAHKVDWLNYLITDIAALCTAAICGAMLYFAVRYRKREGRDHETPQIKSSNLLEFIWTFFPTVVCIYVAYIGVTTYQEMRDIPEDSLVINVHGQKWKWDFTYDREDGSQKSTTDEFVVPVNKPIKLVMNSSDVLHSFFIPKMRVKQDAVPGMYTSLWFKPIKTGTYRTYCTEYCGRDHSQMMSTLHVVSEAEFDSWLSDRSEEEALESLTPAQRGLISYRKRGCNACHSLDGSKLVGPSFLNIYNRKGLLDDGTEYVADEEYIRSSIYDPNSQIVQGYPPNQMVNFTGQIEKDEFNDLLAFLRTVDGKTVVELDEDEEEQEEEAEEASADLTPAQLGEQIYKTKACMGCHSLDGTGVIGPSFKGLYGREGELVSGEKYVANDEYIKNSILDPGSQMVKGFAAAMPPYAGQLSDEDIANVIEFMKTVK